MHILYVYNSMDSHKFHTLYNQQLVNRTFNRDIQGLFSFNEKSKAWPPC